VGLISPYCAFPQEHDSAKPSPVSEFHNLSVIDRSLEELIRDIPELEGVEAAQDQRELSGILKKAGECETTFVQQVPEISAEEQITREDLGWISHSTETKAKKSRDKPSARRSSLASYSYLIIPHLTIDGISFDEFRVPEGTNSGDSGIRNGLTVTKGFALMPLHFHPSLQSESTFRYLGQQKVDERNTYVVAFAQRSEGARFTAQITHLGTSVDIPLQGIAWIEPQNFHIVRMRTDLLSSYPQVKLEVLTTQLEFTEVRLQQVPEALWLPTRVAVTTVSSGKRYRNLHTYGSFKRFGSESKILPGMAIQR
jgi:hypothetical protein